MPVGVAVMARAPVPGEAKTRLIPALGAEGAARLQAWMLARAVETACAAGVGPVELWHAGDATHPAFSAYRASGVPALRAQPEADLGTRMLAALRGSVTSAGALVIGTDCPALTPQGLRDAAAALRGHDAVVVPAEDGGYVLIGMREPRAEAFAGIAWGGEQVMAATRARLRALDWRWAELPPLWDVDRAADLQRLWALYPEARAAAGARSA